MTTANNLASLSSSLLLDPKRSGRVDLVGVLVDSTWKADYQRELAGDWVMYQRYTVTRGLSNKNGGGRRKIFFFCVVSLQGGWVELHPLTPLYDCMFFFSLYFYSENLATRFIR